MKSATCLLLSALLLLSFPPASSGQLAAQANTQIDGVPVTGTAVGGMSSFDQLLPPLMKKWQIPGGAVAVTWQGRLVFARGYGWADQQNRQPVQPDSLFRIASLSKPVTAAAVLKLVETGKLSLDDKPFRLLSHLRPPSGAQVDRRLYDITVRHLLQHSGGWDRDQTFDPMFISPEIARALGVREPVGPETIIRYMMGKPLQFAPGARYSYSNFGYCVLGRVIEKVSGLSYEEFVKRRLLLNARITAMRLGRSLPRGRAPTEVRYYGHPGQVLAPSVFPSVKGPVPWQYGGWSLEAMDAHGGWLASPVDLMRFVTALDGLETGSGVHTRSDILRPETLRLMTARPHPPLSAAGSAVWYGLGWDVRARQGGGLILSHTGALPGTTAIMVRSDVGVAWVAVFNSRPKDFSAFLEEVEETMWQALRKVTAWPSHNLFQRFDEIIILGGPSDRRKK